VQRITDNGSAETKRTQSVQARALQSVPGRPDLFIGVNNAPRRPKSTKFDARRAAAHKRGQWLVDELNAPPGMKPVANGEAMIAGINNHLTETASNTRATQVVRNGCDTCDPGGGSGPGAGTVSTFDDQGGFAAYDTETDGDDGTALLTKQWVADDGTAVLTWLGTDGLYYTNQAMITQTNGKATPAPMATPGPSQSCIPIEHGYMVCGGPLVYPIPKSDCPIIASGTGLAAKWVVAWRLGSKAGDVAALVVGLSVMQRCTSGP
jgi:hypothetical protein